MGWNQLSDVTGSSHTTSIILGGHASNFTQILRPKSVWRPILGSIGGRESVAPGYFRSKGNPSVSPIAPGSNIAWGLTFLASD